MPELKYKDITEKTLILQLLKSVQSIHPCKSVIQTTYDIVKAHSGELRVVTKEGEGAGFIVHLPLT